MVMDYRPVYSSSLVINPPRQARGAATRPIAPAPQPILLSARAITVDVGNNAAISFDPDTCRYIGGWTGGFLDISRTNVASLKGSGAAAPAGTLVFTTPRGPGWSTDGKFTDPRPGGFGALPPEQIHYRGFYRHGEQIVFSYTVGNVEVLDMPGSLMEGGKVVFTRTLWVEPSSTPLSVALGSPVGADVGGRHSINEIPAHKSTEKLKINIYPNNSNRIQMSAADDLKAFCKGGPSTLGPPIVTGGRRAPDSKAYVVDTINVPFNNPAKSWMRTTALDFFSDGRCAVCTMNGDVWIVSNIDDNLQNVTWKRFATGLYEPLGLKIVNDEVYVLGRDQITRLHDLNGDGEADFYENFSNGGVTDPVYHAFNLDLQTDSEGNFYYMVDGNLVPLKVPMHGAVLKVSKDGKKTDVYATGFRAPDGMGMGPNDELISADNQGNWTPVCRINLMTKGGFYGFNGDPRVVTREEIARQRKDYDLPVCWIPYDKDNSTGGQVFVTGKKFGPLEGHMLSTSYGKCKLFEVMWEQVDGMPQGATVELPLQFLSGIHRARMNPVDGQLYVCGLKGWQTAAAQDGCLERVRYTGKPFNLPVEVHVKNNGIAITFDKPVDPTTANDEQSFGIEEWNYRWTSEYGSKLYKVSDPSKVGTDEVVVKSAKLQSDKKTVFLEIPNIHPVMQMRIQVHINGADGNPIECDVDATINHVPGSSAPPVLTSRLPPLPSTGARQ
jgi:glucose/arabinose dehydrogenase